MAADAAGDGTPGRPAPFGDGPAGGSGVLEDARSLWRELGGLAHDRFQLAALEARQAGESLVAMVAAGVMLAVLLGGAWLGLLAAAVLGLVEQGVVASSALLLAVAFNLLAALILCGVIRRKSRHLQFPSTVRTLRPAPPGQGGEAPP